MSLSDLLDFLGSIWYHSEPSQVPYFPNKKLLEHFYVISVFCCGSSFPITYYCTDRFYTALFDNFLWHERDKKIENSKKMSNDCIDTQFIWSLMDLSGFKAYSWCGTKVRSILVSYFIHMRLNFNGFIFLYKKQNKNYFEDNKLSERFGECLFFLTSKNPLTLSLV